MTTLLVLFAVGQLLLGLVAVLGQIQHRARDQRIAKLEARHHRLAEFATRHAARVHPVDGAEKAFLDEFLDVFHEADREYR